MRYIQHLILYIFLTAFYATTLCSQSTDSFNRYYFSSYDELVKFFERPVEDGASFSKQATEFYADVSHKTTLEQAVTACIYQDPAKGIEHYASHVTTYIDPKTKQRYEVPATSFSTGSYHNNLGSIQDKETSSHWKIIAPSGEAHDSAEYTNNPSKFDLLWQQPNNLSDVPGIQCSGQVVQRPDGRNSFQISIGDQDVCMQAHAHSQSLNDRYRAAAQQHQQSMLNPPEIRLQEARNLHQIWMSRCEGYLKKHERGLFREKKCLLLSLNPPMPPIPTRYNYSEIVEYNEAVKTHAWLYGEIEKLSCGFTKIYKGKLWVDKDKARNFKNFYESSVDHIAEEFYKKCPSQKPKKFKAICLSHTVAFHHYDAATLTTLSENWELNRASQRYSQRMQALQNVKQSKGLMRDYSRLLQRHAPFADEYADAFDNCYGTALDQQLHRELCDTRVLMTELTSHYSSHDYPDFYAPIVYRCTALAKQESNISTAFSLADYSDALVRIVSNGMALITHGLQAMAEGQMLVAQCDEMTPEDIRLMTDVACGAGGGVMEGIRIALTPEHWASLVTSLPTLILHRMTAIHDLHVQSGAITQAFIDGVLSQNKSLYEVECKKFEDQNQLRIQLRIQSIKQALIDITSLSAHDFAKHAACFGTMLALDSLGIHAFNLAASSVGRAAVSKIATVFESPKASHTMAEVAGVGRVAVEEGVEIANKAVQPIKKSPSVAQQSKQPIVQATQDLKLMESYGLKLIGKDVWQSPGGLLFGYDGKFGNRFLHVFDHMRPNPTKEIHSIFSVPKNKLVELLDEAWSMRQNPLPKNPKAYDINMKRVIGTNGENGIRIVVEAGTSNVITAYPIKI